MHEQPDDKYRVLFDMARDAIFIADAETGILLDCNRAAEELVNRKKPDIVGQHQSLLHPKRPIIRGVTQSFENRRKGVIKNVAEDQIVTSDGVVRDVAVHANVIDWDGRIVLHGIFRDITDQKATSERLRLATKSAQIGVWEWDIAENKLVWDEAMYCLYGVDPDKFGGAYDAWLNGLHPEDRKAADNCIKRALSGEAEYDLEFRVVWPDQSIHHIKASAVVKRDDTGKPLRMVGVNWDISAERERENGLRFQVALLNVLPIPVFYKGRDFNYTGCNRAYAELLGKTESEIIGKSSTDLHPAHVAMSFVEWDKRIFENREPQTFEGTLQSPSKGVRQILTYRRCILDDQQRPVGIVGAVVDVTDIKKGELERQQLQAQLIHAAKLASIGTLAAGVAHEINNPLTIISGNISLQERKLKQGCSPETLASLLEPQKKAVGRISGIVSQLRTYARADTDIVTDVNIHDIVNDTMSMVQSIFVKDGVELESILRSKSPIVTGNIGKLQQVLMNLVSNAKDATESVSGAKITVETVDDDGFIQLRISDNGSGIDPRHLTTIFDAFFTTKDAGKGTGLGLSISSSIVASFGGKISVESEVGIGTTFTVRLPATRSQHSAKAATPIQDTVTLKGTVLVVDDEEDIRLLLTEYLQELGLTVAVAVDGVQALEKLNRHAYDYVISDLKMPHKNGDVLLAEARALPHLAKTKFMIITGGIVTDYTKEQRSSIRRLADGYLKKPFMFDDVANSMMALTKTQRNPDENGDSIDDPDA